jgi:hypothetical protein
LSLLAVSDCIRAAFSEPTATEAGSVSDLRTEKSEGRFRALPS